eukprot:scaffold2114_cov253-Pinguiococcus_pyrenoidosus.AAC.30
MRAFHSSSRASAPASSPFSLGLCFFSSAELIQRHLRVQRRHVVVHAQDFLYALRHGLCSAIPTSVPDGHELSTPAYRCGLGPLLHPARLGGGRALDDGKGHGENPASVLAVVQGSRSIRGSSRGALGPPGESVLFFGAGKSKQLADPRVFRRTLQRLHLLLVLVLVLVLLFALDHLVHLDQLGVVGAFLKHVHVGLHPLQAAAAAHRGVLVHGAHGDVELEVVQLLEHEGLSLVQRLRRLRRGLLLRRSRTCGVAEPKHRRPSGSVVGSIFPPGPGHSLVALHVVLGEGLHRVAAGHGLGVARERGILDVVRRRCGHVQHAAIYEFEAGGRGA